MSDSIKVTPQPDPSPQPETLEMTQLKDDFYTWKDETELRVKRLETAVEVLQRARRQETHTHD